MEFPKDADMKPPKGFNALLEAFSSIRHQQIIRGAKNGMEIMNNWKGGHEDD
jgi:hypothetical protein